jgi:divalent metal cation (Fe/Co/Zn/Cd) transporter
MSDPIPYKSDRWVTPGVVIVGVLVAGVCILATIAAVAWLTARGLNPEPMLKLVGVAVAALASLGNFALTLAQRRTATKVERNTGILANAVYDVADALPRVTAPPPPRHAYEDTAVVRRGAAPAPPGR